MLACKKYQHQYQYQSKDLGPFRPSELIKKPALLHLHHVMSHLQQPAFYNSAGRKKYAISIKNQIACVGIGKQTDNIISAPTYTSVFYHLKKKKKSNPCLSRCVYFSSKLNIPSVCVCVHHHLIPCKTKTKPNPSMDGWTCPIFLINYKL